jgi:hypothetical protein
LDEDTGSQFSQFHTGSVGFTDVQEKFSEIVRFVSNDKSELATLYAFADQVLSAYRDGMKVCLECNTSGTRDNNPRAFIRPLNNGSLINRKKSRLEISHNHQQKNAGTENVGQEEVVLLEQMGEMETVARAAKKYKRTCGLCNGSGHHAFSCPIIITYGVPLQRNDVLGRQTLQRDLLLSHGFGLTPMVDENAQIHTSLPKGVAAMVIHARFTFQNDIVIEASLVRQGMIDRQYQKCLFATGPVVAWLSNARSKPIVSCLKHNAAQPNVDVPLSEPLGIVQQAEPSILFANRPSFLQQMAHSQPLYLQGNDVQQFNQFSQQQYLNSQLSQSMSQLSQRFN